MRPTTVLLVSALNLLIVGGWLGAQAHAAEDSPSITRVAIAVLGGPVVYTDQLKEDVPAIVIEFRSRDVRAQLEPLVPVEAGIIKNIQTEYYPAVFGRRALKSLTLNLSQSAPYRIIQRANQILIDIETPPDLLPGQLTVSRGVTILGIEANETLLQRLKAMEGALQEAAPPVAEVSPKLKPVVVTKPVEIPKPVSQPEPTRMPVSRGGLGWLWPGVLLGIGGTIAIVSWRRRRKALAVPEGSAELVSMVGGASVYEQLILKATQRQGQQVIGSKAVEGLGTLWIIESGGERQGLLCLIDGEFFERKALEQFHDALQQEHLGSGTVMALGAFTAPAMTFAKEHEIALIARDELLKLISVELRSPTLALEVEPLRAQLAQSQSELAPAQERIKTLEQDLSTHAEFKQKVKAELEAWEKEAETLKKKWQESEWYLGEERTKRQGLEQQVAELAQNLAVKEQLYAKLAQEADQLKAKSAEVDQRLAAAQEKRSQLETQIAQMEELLKVQAAAVAEKSAKEEPIQEPAVATKEEVAVGATEIPQERRKWPRLDLSARTGKGILVRATSDDGEPINGDARNVSAGGICLELPQGERLADEFELKLFFPGRTKSIEAIGKIVWKGRGSRRQIERMGVAFSAINAIDQEAIKQFIEERKPEPVTVG